LASWESTQAVELLVSIAFYVLPSKGVLGPAEQSADRSAVEIQNPGNLFVSAAMTAQNQEFNLARPESCENTAHTLLLFGGGMKLFGGGGARGGEETRESFVAMAAPAFAKLVEASAESDPVKPGFVIPCLGFRAAPKLQKDLHSKFFRTRGIAKHTGNKACNSHVVGPEDGFDIEVRVFYIGHCAKVGR
jgi:hypothetical protein